jgi:hypothetical protein
MGGQGSFSEPRLNLSVTNGTQDLVTRKPPTLQAYQLTLKAPAPPARQLRCLGRGARQVDLRRFAPGAHGIRFYERE